jgi:hypothetical protein
MAPMRKLLLLSTLFSIGGNQVQRMTQMRSYERLSRAGKPRQPALSTGPYHCDTCLLSPPRRWLEVRRPSVHLGPEAVSQLSGCHGVR